MVMGNAILFPKTYSRLNSLKRGAKDGIKILVSLVPVLAVAAFLEGYLTRHTNLPVVVSAVVLLLSLLFIIGYYVWLPIKVHQRKQSAISLAKS